MNPMGELSAEKSDTSNPRPDPVQQEEVAWSFGPSRRRLIGPSRPPEIASRAKPASANQNGPLTMGPQQIESPPPPAVTILPRNFGRRGLQALSEWEGVVEEIKGRKFRCRLLPVEDGRPNRGRVEFTEFDLDDLASDSDVDLVQPGAVFYWTIGRSQNAAGTRTNVSLVRFRRIPSATASRVRRARREADDLIREIGDASNGGSARP